MSDEEIQNVVIKINNMISEIEKYVELELEKQDVLKIDGKKVIVGKRYFLRAYTPRKEIS